MDKRQRIQSWFINRSIRVKLALVFVITMALMSFINIFMYSSINEMLSTFDQVYASNVSLNVMLSTLEALHSNLYQYLSTKSSDVLTEYYRLILSYQDQIGQLNTHSTDNEQKLAEKNIKNLSDSYISMVEEAVEAKRGRDVEKYKKLYEDASREYGYLNTYINNLNERQFRYNSENYGSLRKNMQYMQSFSIVVLLTATIGNLLALLLISNTITDPLIKLARQAEQVGQGDFEVDFIDPQTQDEVGTLANAFRRMIDSLNRYLLQSREQMAKESRLKEEQLRMQNSLRESQLIFLQSQINPHFLYNTLNAGAQLAMMEGAEKTCLFMENLADFFRYNVKRTGEISSLEDEIQQVETYLRIINVRFSGEIAYEKHITGSIYGVMLPGVILQPIVENAINHGLRDIEGQKRILLSSVEEDHRIVVCISDNGAGMTENQIYDIFYKNSEDAALRPTGLKNVIERLKIFYHDDTPLSIHSDGLGCGTQISIRIPKMEDTPHV